MPILFLFLLVVSTLELSFADSPLPDRYHTYSEIDSILHELNNEFGDTINVNSPYGASSGTIFKLIELGTSTKDELPFWAVKLSFNANLKQDKPRVLILGQCHAEEILGGGIFFYNTRSGTMGDVDAWRDAGWVVRLWGFSEGDVDLSLNQPNCPATDEPKATWYDEYLRDVAAPE